MKKRKILIPALVATLLIGGVSTGIAYATYMNRATATGNITRNIQHGIATTLNFNPNPYNDTKLLPGDEYPFTITVTNTANYAQDVKTIVTPDFCSINGDNRWLIYELDQDEKYNGSLNGNKVTYTLGTMQPGQAITLTGRFTVDDTAINPEHPNASTANDPIIIPSDDYTITLNVESTGVQLKRGSGN